ncbi:MAG: prolipoprotein diacylglyceryl transferase [Bacilli bacterium]
MIDINTLAYPQGIPSNNPVIKFYGIIIVLGACLALFLSNYRAHKDGYDWHFFDTVFLVAFPLGIVGARLWYLIATWPECAPTSTKWYAPIAIWDGGLAIQGGIILGVLAGAIFIFTRRKGTSLLRAIDFAIPTVLIAQAIGRWGNFFNQEVFGHAVSPEAWNFLPSFITNNMQNGSMSMLSGVSLPQGAIAAPLFLVEGIVNLMFFFIIGHILPSVLGKHYKNGDTSFAYFIAYGVTRLILEPLRNPLFIMGVTSSSDLSRSHFNSLIMAIVFIVFGVVTILGNHVIRYICDKKGISLEKIGFSSKSKQKEEKTFHSDDSIDLSKIKAKEQNLNDSEKKE